MIVFVSRNRDAEIEAAWRGMAGRCAASLDEFAEALKAFDVGGIYGESLMGAIVLRGPEAHVSMLPEYRRKWLSRSVMRQILDPLIKAHGKAITAVMADNVAGQEFVERLGFRNTGATGNVLHYEATEDDLLYSKRIQAPVR